MLLFDCNLEGDWFLLDRFVILIALGSYNNFDLVSSFLEALLYGNLSVLLVDSDLLVATLLGVGEGALFLLYSENL